MAQARKSRGSKLKVTAIALLLTGVLLASLNFFYPVATLQHHYQPVTNLHKYSVDSTSVFNVSFITLQNSNDYLFNFTAAGYWYSSPLHLNQGQVLSADWETSINQLVGYIFSESQFDHFQSIFSLLVNSTRDATVWSNGTGFSFEAEGIGNRYGEVSYEAAQSGNYVYVITNGQYGNGNEFTGFFCNGVVVTPYRVIHYVQLSDNLFLYLGTGFLVTGTISLIFGRHRKTANFEQ